MARTHIAHIWEYPPGQWASLTRSYKNKVQVFNKKGFAVQGQRRLFIHSTCKLIWRVALLNLMYKFMNLEDKIYCECYSAN